MQREWTPDEVEKLKALRLDRVKNSRDKLVALVRHFKASLNVWAVAEGANNISVSRPFAAKIRDLTIEGKLDWLLQDQGLTRSESGGDGGTVADPADTGWALQMEQSGHWPGLRTAAVSLSAQLRAPVQQLIDLSEWDARN